MQSDTPMMSDGIIESIRGYCNDQVGIVTRPVYTIEIMRGVLARLDHEIAERERLESKLPKTADGVPVFAGDHVWDDNGDEFIIGGWAEWDPGNQCYSVGLTALHVTDRSYSSYIDCCYSTPEAARAAKGPTDA